MSNDWTQTPPPVPDGMPEGTEWVAVECRTVSVDRMRWFVAIEDMCDDFSFAIDNGLTALAFPMPDGTWRISHELVPVHGFYHAEPHGWLLERWPNVHRNQHARGGPVSARWALMVPPRVYGAEAAPPTGATAAP